MVSPIPIWSRENGLIDAIVNALLQRIDRSVAIDSVQRSSSAMCWRFRLFTDSEFSPFFDRVRFEGCISRLQEELTAKIEKKTKHNYPNPSCPGSTERLVLARLKSNSSKFAVMVFSAFPKTGKETKIPPGIWKTRSLKNADSLKREMSSLRAETVPKRANARGSWCGFYISFRYSFMQGWAIEAMEVWTCALHVFFSTYLIVKVLLDIVSLPCTCSYTSS